MQFIVNQELRERLIKVEDILLQKAEGDLKRKKKKKDRMRGCGEKWVMTNMEKGG